MTESASKQQEPPPGLEALDPLARKNRLLDLTSAILSAGVLAVIEMGGAIAKKGFNASDLEVALLTSGQSGGLLLSFFIAHLASKHGRVPLVFVPELISRLLLMCVFFLRPTFALAFVILQAGAHILQVVTIPARITVYRHNYPNSLRGRIVSRIRRTQLFLSALVALAMSLALDWNLGKEDLVKILGLSPIPPNLMVNYVVPVIAAIGLLGSFIYLQIREPESPASRKQTASIRETFQRALAVYRNDREFRRYENFFFLFGFANIMSIPLVQIHAVEVLNANYFDLALINVVLVQGLMAVSMPFWGRLVDRYTPNTLRGLLNIVFCIDFLVLALAPTIGWVFLGRVFRGIAMGGGVLVWMLGSLYFARSREQAPIYLGIHTVLTGSRWLIAPYVGVLFKQLFGQNARPIFFISFLVILLASFLMLRDARKQQRRPPEEEPIPSPRDSES